MYWIFRTYIQEVGWIITYYYWQWSKQKQFEYSICQIKCNSSIWWDMKYKIRIKDLKLTPSLILTINIYWYKFVYVDWDSRSTLRLSKGWLTRKYSDHSSKWRFLNILNVISEKIRLYLVISSVFIGFIIFQFIECHLMQYILCLIIC